MAILATGAPARGQFGTLAPGALQWTLDGVEGEIGVTFAMNPRFLTGRVPRGFKPLTLESLAKGDDSVARALLATHPDRANYVIAIYSAAAVDVLVVAGAPLRCDQMDRLFGGYPSFPGIPPRSSIGAYLEAIN